VRRWDPESKTFTAVLSQPSKLALRLFNYPAWRVDVNGSTIHAETKDVTGQMLIPLPAGESEVRIIFVRTWDRLAGGLISVFSACLVSLFLILRKDYRFGRSGT
jgi:hypothetical protein